MGNRGGCYRRPLGYERRRFGTLIVRNQSSMDGERLISIMEQLADGIP